MAQKLNITSKRFERLVAIEPTDELDVLGKALAVHAINAAEISYLYDVYRGKQDILDKTKIVRSEINNKVVVNRANEIVTFKTAYLLNEPIQYVSHGGDDAVSENVNRLNEMMREESKEAKDKEIVDWMHISGWDAERVIETPVRFKRKSQNGLCV